MGIFKKRHIFYILFICITQAVFAQDISEDGLTFKYHTFRYEIKADKANSGKKTEFYLEITNLLTHTLSKQALSSNGYDSPRFGAFINDTKKYILIQSRYTFALLNLYTHQVSNAYRPRFRGLGQDAQSGMLTGLKIQMNGRIITGYCVDSGPFLFDFINSYAGKEVTPAGLMNPENKQLFLLAHPADNETYTGILLQSESWECKSKIVFRLENISAVDSPKAVGNEDELLAIPNYEIRMRYTLLEQSTEDETHTYFVYDLRNEQLIRLPKTVSRSGKKGIYRYLRNIKD